MEPRRDRAGQGQGGYVCETVGSSVEGGSAKSVVNLKRSQAAELQNFWVIFFLVFCLFHILAIPHRLPSICPIPRSTLYRSSPNSYKNSNSSVALFLFYCWGKWITEELLHFSKFAQAVSGRVQPKQSLPKVCVFQRWMWLPHPWNRERGEVQTTGGPSPRRRQSSHCTHWLVCASSQVIHCNSPKTDLYERPNEQFSFPLWSSDRRSSFALIPEREFN